jgi:hypothetical protein
MIRAHVPHSAPFRTILVVSLVVAAWSGTGGALAHAQRAGRPPASAVTRLTSLGFSPGEARCLLRVTAARPGTGAGAYAAQRIAMAVLFGNAHACGSPGHHPARRTEPCAAFSASRPPTGG